MEFEPPQGGCIIGNRNHFFNLLRETGKGVRNILIDGQAVRCGNASGPGQDEFGLTPMSAPQVRLSLSSRKLFDSRGDRDYQMPATTPPRSFSTIPALHFLESLHLV